MGSHIQMSSLYYTRASNIFEIIKRSRGRVILHQIIATYKAVYKKDVDIRHRNFKSALNHLKKEGYINENSKGYDLNKPSMIK